MQNLFVFRRESKDTSEEHVLMRALRDTNLPKFVFDDVPLFLGLLDDLFPGLECPCLQFVHSFTLFEKSLFFRHSRFCEAIEKELNERGYQVKTQTSQNDISQNDSLDRSQSSRQNRSALRSYANETYNDDRRTYRRRKSDDCFGFCSKFFFRASF